MFRVVSRQNETGNCQTRIIGWAGMEHQEQDRQNIGVSCPLTRFKMGEGSWMVEGEAGLRLIGCYR